MAANALLLHYKINNMQNFKEKALMEEGLNIFELWDRETPLRQIRSKANEDCLKKIFGCEDINLINALIIEEAIERNLTPGEREMDILDEVYYGGTAQQYLAFI